MPSSQTIMGAQLIQGRYAVAWVRFESATLRFQGTEPTPTPPYSINIVHKFNKNTNSNYDNLRGAVP